MVCRDVSRGRREVESWRPDCKLPYWKLSAASTVRERLACGARAGSSAPTVAVIESTPHLTAEVRLFARTERRSPCPGQLRTSDFGLADSQAEETGRSPSPPRSAQPLLAAMWPPLPSNCQAPLAAGSLSRALFSAAAITLNGGLPFQQQQTLSSQLQDPLRSPS